MYLIPRIFVALLGSVVGGFAAFFLRIALCKLGVVW